MQALRGRDGIDGRDGVDGLRIIPITEETQHAPPHAIVGQFLLVTVNQARVGSVFFPLGALLEIINLDPFIVEYRGNLAPLPGNNIHVINENAFRLPLDSPIHVNDLVIIGRDGVYIGARSTEPATLGEIYQITNLSINEQDNNFNDVVVIYQTNIRGYQGLQGNDGSDGSDGSNGSNGISVNWLGRFTNVEHASNVPDPQINDAYYRDVDDVSRRGSWVWNGINWSRMSRDGINGLSPHIGDNGHWFVGPDDTGVRADAIMPHIGSNGNWFVGDHDTEVRAQGNRGVPGEAPHIGQDGNWWVGDENTHVPARGDQGHGLVINGTVPTYNDLLSLSPVAGNSFAVAADGLLYTWDGTAWPAQGQGIKISNGLDGVTPHIGANGNWFIDDFDTNLPSRGVQGEPGLDSTIPGPPGDEGLPGRSIRWRAEDEFTQANPPPDPQINDAYNDYSASPSVALIFTEQGWQVLVESGRNGLDGFSIYRSHEQLDAIDNLNHPVLNNPTWTHNISISSINVPPNRTLRAGDLIQIKASVIYDVAKDLYYDALFQSTAVFVDTEHNDVVVNNFVKLTGAPGKDGITPFRTKTYSLSGSPMMAHPVMIARGAISAPEGSAENRAVLTNLRFKFPNQQGSSQKLFFDIQLSIMSNPSGNVMTTVDILQPNIILTGTNSPSTSLNTAFRIPRLELVFKSASGPNSLPNSASVWYLCVAGGTNGTSGVNTFTIEILDSIGAECVVLTDPVSVTHPVGSDIIVRQFTLQNLNIDYLERTRQPTISTQYTTAYSASFKIVTSNNYLSIYVSMLIGASNWREDTALSDIEGLVAEITAYGEIFVPCICYVDNPNNIFCGISISPGSAVKLLSLYGTIEEYVPYSYEILTLSARSIGVPVHIRTN